jgi:hypothetical protein
MKRLFNISIVLIVLAIPGFFIARHALHRLIRVAYLKGVAARSL